jgi:hypothetical protein
MGTVVVGIFADHDGIAKLTESLKSGGYSVERLRVITPETPADELISSGVQFMMSGDTEDESIADRGGIITSFGGTGVPGLTSSIPRVEAFHAPSLAEMFSELDIPDRRVGDFETAIEQGRSVAGYNAHDQVETVKSLFRDSGAFPVDVF